MVLVDILRPALQRESCAALCLRSEELWTSKVRWRVPNPPPDSSEKVKRRSHPDQELADFSPPSVWPLGGGGGGEAGLEAG